MRASAWFTGTDMLVRLDTVQTSTMGSTSYLNSSTGVTVEVWSALTTASTSDLVSTARNMPYVTGSNGRYQLVIQSTVHGFTSTDANTAGMAHITVDHSGVDAEFWPQFLVGLRRSS